MVFQLNIGAFVNFSDPEKLPALQDTTVAVFKAVCLASIASLAILTYICYTQYPELLIHCIFALSLSVFLYALMHW